MKKIIPVLFYLLGATPTFAQGPNNLWARSTTGATQQEWGQGTAVDPNGNIYVAGYTNSSSITFGTVTLTPPGAEGIVLVKYSPAGNVLWARTALAEAFDVCTDPFGNVIVTGFFSTPTIVFGSTTLTNTGIVSPFIVKYDSLGNVLWAKNGLGSKYDYTRAITSDASGNIYVTGDFSSPTLTFGSATLNLTGTLNLDIFLLKYDASGNIVWAKSNGGTANDSGQGIACDTGGNIFVSGYYKSPTITFGTTTFMNSTGDEFFFITKYDALGNIIWAKTAVEDGVTYSTSRVATDALNNAIATGTAYGTTVAFGTDTISSGNFIVKYDNVGNVVWARNFGASPADVATDSGGNIYVFGAFYGSLIVGTDTLLNHDPVHTDGYITKFDASGNFIWSEGFGSTLNDEIDAITFDHNGNMICLGAFCSNSITIGASSFINSNLSGSFRELFITKLNNDDVVWPGDANGDHLVDNTDLLQIGLFYGQTGPARATTGNVWQSDIATNWGMTEANGMDIKNADCNGDGAIDNNDTLAVNLNFSLSHAFIPNQVDLRASIPEIYFISSAPSYSPGQTVDVEVWVGTSSFPANDVYGISFNVSYEANYVQSGTEAMNYPISWLGSPGINAIKIFKADALANTAFGAVVRTDHLNSNGYGKIADFQFKLNNTIAVTDSIHFSISNYTAIDSSGTNLPFNQSELAVEVTAGTAEISELGNLENLSVFPNPFTSSTQISYTLNASRTTLIEVFDLIGNKIETLVNSTQLPGNYKYQFSTKEKEYETGVYFLKISLDGKSSTRKIIKVN